MSVKMLRNVIWTRFFTKPVCWQNSVVIFGKSYLSHMKSLNALMLLIPYVSCHSVLCDDFNVYSDFVFGINLWISRDIAFLTIPCVRHDSIFAIDSIRQLCLIFQ